MPRGSEGLAWPRACQVAEATGNLTLPLFWAGPPQSGLIPLSLRGQRKMGPGNGGRIRREIALGVSTNPQQETREQKSFPFIAVVPDDQPCSLVTLRHTQVPRKLPSRWGPTSSPTCMHLGVTEGCQRQSRLSGTPLLLPGLSSRLCRTSSWIHQWFPRKHGCVWLAQGSFQR